MKGAGSKSPGREERSRAKTFVGGASAWPSAWLSGRPLRRWLRACCRRLGVLTAEDHPKHRICDGEIVRMTLLGNSEWMSAARAHQIGLVSELCPIAELRERAAWVAGEIAKAPALAVQGSLRALWAGLELSRSQALGFGWAFVGLGTDQRYLDEGQAAIEAGVKVKPRVR